MDSWFRKPKRTDCYGENSVHLCSLISLIIEPKTDQDTKIQIPDQ